jgi:hypothetical protein
MASFQELAATPVHLGFVPYDREHLTSCGADCYYGALLNMACMPAVGGRGT